MKIVLIHHFSLSYIGGGEKFIIEVYGLLRQRGHDVEVRALPIHDNVKHGWNFHEYMKYTESWFHKINEADVVYFVFAPVVWRLLVRADAPKVAGIHASSLVPEIQSQDIFPRSPIKLIKYHGVLSTVTYYYFKYFKKSELSQFDALHIINPAMKFDHPRMYYVPLFIDTRFYRPTKPKSERPSVLFVGRPLFKKGFDLFVEAAKIIRKYDNNIRFLTTGLRGMVDGVVEGLGTVPENELPDLYSSVHVIVYPSRIDTFGKVILEAMASGTPVITSPIQAHVNLNLPLIYASTAKDIAQKILYIIRMSEDEYKDFSARCRKSVVDQYDVEKVFPKFERMLIEVANK